jgi:hypothetical protein
MSETVKVTEEVLNQLKSRTTALQSASVLFQMAQREYTLFIAEQLDLLNLDKSKQYNVDSQTGEINELKTEPVKKEIPEIKVE